MFVTRSVKGVPYAGAKETYKEAEETYYIIFETRCQKL
jgi:hypothetical protein